MSTDKIENTSKLSMAQALLHLSPLRKGKDHEQQDFLKSDCTSSPDFKFNQKKSKELAALRTEYVEETDAYLPIKRSLVGKPFSYQQSERMVNKREQEDDDQSMLGVLGR